MTDRAARARDGAGTSAGTSEWFQMSVCSRARDGRAALSGLVQAQPLVVGVVKEATIIMRRGGGGRNMARLVLRRRTRHNELLNTAVYTSGMLLPARPLLGTSWSVSWLPPSTGEQHAPHTRPDAMRRGITKKRTRPQGNPHGPFCDVCVTEMYENVPRYLTSPISPLRARWARHCRRIP